MFSQTIVVPHTYLQSAEMEETDDMKLMTRAVGIGIM